MRARAPSTQQLEREAYETYLIAWQAYERAERVAATALGNLRRLAHDAYRDLEYFAELFSAVHAIEPMAQPPAVTLRLPSVIQMSMPRPQDKAHMNPLHAKLAWFGGGAVVLGGLGMVGGAAAFGALFAAPAFGVGYVVQQHAGRHRCAMAEATLYRTRHEAAELWRHESFLRQVPDALASLYYAITVLRRRLLRELHALRELIASSGSDYGRYSKAEQQRVNSALQIARGLSALLRVELQEPDGTLRAGLDDVLDAADRLARGEDT